MEKKADSRKMYSPPETQVSVFQITNGILTISGNDASLTGAGVDESEADENGNIW